MTTPISRRQFLRGRLSTKHSSIRPPWAIEEKDFLERCSRCGDCVDACEEDVIRSDSGYPIIDFSNSGCSFCGDCATACDAGAIRQTQTPAWPYAVKIEPAQCLAQQGVVCQVCSEQCDSGAIRISLTVAAVPTPVINETQCTACGYCIATCPGNALSINTSYRQQPQKEALCM
ncbi:MAG: ferredoxin-type protein NapF [Proteobacteria bacterium]|nr:ferredoxin-type protein NapF [Pseudomonadota bacterium]